MPALGSVASPIRIVVVDDDALVSRMVTAAIKRMRPDAIVEQYDDGHDAISRAQSEPFAAAVIDLHMPTLSGIRTAEGLRARAPDLPIVFITGAIDSNLADEARQVRRAVVLEKPVAGSSLREALADVLR